MAEQQQQARTDKVLSDAIEKLRREHSLLRLSLEEVANEEGKYLRRGWPGDPKESVMLCVYGGDDRNEMFHRHDFFFFDYAYRNDHEAYCDTADNLVLVREDDCYIGQPFSAHAILRSSDRDTVIVGLLIQKDAFVRDFMSAITGDFYLSHFFLDPRKNPALDGYIHLSFGGNPEIRRILDLMLIEYASHREDTQNILIPMALTFLMLVSREYKSNIQKKPHSVLIYRIIEYINSHPDTVTLRKIAEEFSYHPNYLSALIRSETGQSFSELLHAQRMQKATLLLKTTGMPMEEIAAILGYRDVSSFYRAFRKHFGMSPKEYMRQQAGQ